MALTKCKECGNEIAKSAKACPKCGAPVKRTGCLTMGLAIFLGLAVLGGIVGSCEESKRKDAEAEQAAAAQAADQQRKAAEQAKLAAMSPEERAAEEKRLADAAAELEQRKQEAAEAARRAQLRSEGLIWTYQTDTDELTGKPVRIARVRSENQVEFDFPYQEPQRATLWLRKHPKHGNNVIFQIERGQLMCDYDGCNVSVRFDDGPVQQFTANESADNDSTVLFISNYSRFVKAVAGAKQVRMAATVYQEGAPTFVFNTEGLEWK